jgi:hypothetical protein
MLSTERHQLCNLLLHGLSLPETVVQQCSPAQGETQTVDVRHLPSQTQRLVEPFQSLVWIAEEPQDIGCIFVAESLT